MAKPGDQDRAKSSEQGTARKKQSPLRSYNILLAVTIVVAFILLAVAYTKLLSDSMTSDKVRLMNRTADTLLLTNNLEDEFKLGGRPSEEALENLNAAADISGSAIWLVRVNGELYYYSGIPRAAIGSLYIQPNGRLYLPNQMLQLSVPPGGLTFTGGNFLGIFQDGRGSWLSVVRPLYNSNGQMIGTLQLHDNLDILTESENNILAGFFLVMLVSVIVAVLVIRIYANRMSRPIELLSEAANQVAKGDFSTRIDYSQYEGDVSYMSGMPEEDLMNLMRIFNRMTEQIEQHNSEQRDFIASISHDLRTPLTSIGGFVTAILDGTIPQEQQERYLTIVQDETRRLAALVGEMNDAIAFDKGQAPVEFQKFDIHSLIRRVISSQEVLLNEKNISVTTDQVPQMDQKLFVLGDEKQIERVLYNLISNAVKFINQDGVIAISTRAQGHDVLYVSVEDNGPGIAPEDLPHVFDRFFKGDKSRTDRKGSGLGLYICKRILANHGQDIYVGKGQMGGAKFDFTLPLA